MGSAAASQLASRWQGSEVSDVLLGARELEFVPCSELFLDSVETFQRQTKTRLSFVDATIVNLACDRADGLVATLIRF